MSQLLGNVYQPGAKACLCVLSVESTVLVATPREAGSTARAFRFPLRDENLSFGGDGGSQLILKNQDGATLYADRSLLEPALAGKSDRAFQDRLKQEGKRIKRSHRVSLAGLLAFFVGCGLLLGLGVLALNWGVDRMVDRIPLAWEESLGELVVKGGIGPEIIDPRVVEPVEAVLNRLAEAEPNQRYDFKLHVIESEEVNAFAAPGGQIIVYTGLLEKTTGPDELAGVLAHELQHVYNRHGLRNMVHTLKWQVLASIIIGDVGSVQQVLLANAPDFLSLSYGRSLEEEADLEGIELLCRAHLTLRGWSIFFEC